MRCCAQLEARVLNHDNSPLVYGKAGGDNPYGFVAFGID